MAGEMGLLIEKVLQNSLILKIVFRQIDLEKLYPIRQVSKIWKDAVDIILRKRLVLTLCLNFEDGMDEMDEMISDLKYFGSLNLNNIRIYWSEEMRENIFTAFHVKEYGKQIKTLKIDGLNLATENDYLALELLLFSMPNLRWLDLQLWGVNVPLFLKFNPKVSINTVQINGSKLEPEAEVEEVVSQILKIFPNLGSNFVNCNLDNYLVKHLSKRKGPMPSLRKLKFESDGKESVDSISLLSNVNPADLPNLKRLYIDIGMPTEFANDLKKCLTDFSSLEKVTILCAPDYGRRLSKTMLVSLPPLKKLRILRLGIPPIINGFPVFLWDLGKRVAKDFPILEELIIENDWEDVSPQFAWEKYKYPEAWCIWEPFVPILGKDNVDISPLKTVKRVEFGLPPDWVRDRDNFSWVKSFLDVCNRLYPKMFEYKNEDILKLLAIFEKHESPII